MKYYFSIYLQLNYPEYKATILLRNTISAVWFYHFLHKIW